MKAHEGCVRSFVGWLFAHRHPERLDGRPVLVSFFVEPREIYEKSEVQLSQLLHACLRSNPHSGPLATGRQRRGRWPPGRPPGRGSAWRRAWPPRTRRRRPRGRSQDTEPATRPRRPGSGSPPRPVPCGRRGWSPEGCLRRLSSPDPAREETLPARGAAGAPWSGRAAWSGSPPFSGARRPPRWSSRQPRRGSRRATLS